MSKPLSILLTLLLLVVPGIVTDRCSPESPAVCRCGVPGAGEPSRQLENGGGSRAPRSAARVSHGRWAFVAQGLAISIVDRIVSGRLHRAG